MPLISSRFILAFLRDIFKLINPLLSHIPEQIPGDEDLRLIFSVHDGPAAQSSWTLVDRSRDLAGKGLGKSALTQCWNCFSNTYPMNYSCSPVIVWEKGALATVERKQSPSRGW